MNRMTFPTFWRKSASSEQVQAEERPKTTVTNNLILHLHPHALPADALKFWYTWGLGGISAVLAVLIGLTGILLMFRYDPRVDFAYISIQELETQIVFGSLVRGIHHWSANLLVVTSFLHLLRVFFTGGFKQGRTLNWIVGVVLFLLALVGNFTGYLLPWDQLAYWAITVSTNLMSYIPLIGSGLRTFLLGGPTVGQVAINNFYALHVVILPVIAVSLLAYHFWKVRKNGGISQPKPEPGQHPQRVMTIPHLVNVELAAALGTITFVILFAMLKPAELGPIANPFHSPNPAKAAWYFMGLQELLLHMHPLAAEALIGAVFAALVAIPYLDKKDDDIGIYFRSAVGKRAALWGALIGANLTPIMVILDQYWLDLPTWLPSWPTWLTIGVIPLVATLAVFAGLYIGFRRTKIVADMKANHSEAVLGVFTFAATALVMLTIIGVYFRGPNMALVLPF